MDKEIFDASVIVHSALAQQKFKSLPLATLVSLRHWWSQKVQDGLQAGLITIRFDERIGRKLPESA